MNKFCVVKFLTITPFVIVSGKPPLFETTTAQPRLDASKLVLPKGSSHREHATVILVFLKILITSVCFLKPSIEACLCDKFIFSLFFELFI